MIEHNKNQPSLELAPSELSIPLKVTLAGRAYRVTHHLRPPQTEDWFAYERALRMAVEELPPAPPAAGFIQQNADEGDGGEVEAASEEPRFRFHVRSADAALELWNRLVLSVDGYSVVRRESQPAPACSPVTQSDAAPVLSSNAAGRGLSPDEKDGRSRIPLAHKEAAVRSLTLVAPAELTPSDSAEEFFPLDADRIPVVLEAARAGRAYPRLLHSFRPPMVEDERRYRRLMAESLIVGGTRAPRTLIPARLPALCRLYDALIFSVEGYSVNGEHPASSREIVQRMDAWHKRAAVQSLFGDAGDISPVPPAASEEGSAA